MLPFGFESAVCYKSEYSILDITEFIYFWKGIPWSMAARSGVLQIWPSKKLSELLWRADPVPSTVLRYEIMSGWSFDRITPTKTNLEGEREDGDRNTCPWDPI